MGNLTSLLYYTITPLSSHVNVSTHESVLQKGPGIGICIGSGLKHCYKTMLDPHEGIAAALLKRVHGVRGDEVSTVARIRHPP